MFSEVDDDQARELSNQEMNFNCQLVSMRRCEYACLLDKVLPTIEVGQDS